MARLDLGKDLVAASARPVVLSLLHAGESYGYAILKRVKELSGGQIEWTDGMLYPVLHRLEAEGLVVATWRKAPDTGRRRKYYRLSAKGKPALVAEKQRWQAVEDVLHGLWENDACPT